MAESAVGHQTVVHTLDKWRNYENRQCFYGVDNFLGTEPGWDSVPLIFAQQHPNLKMVKTNLNDALQKVKDYKGRPGRIAGHLEQSRVVIAGQPRLETRTVFDDPEVQTLYDQGKLSLSSGFVCNESNDGRLEGKVEPNHMLVFVQDRYNQGREPGAMFLNKEEGNDVTEHNHIGKVISGQNKSKFRLALDSLMSLFKDMSQEDEGANDVAVTNKEEVDMDKEQLAELEKLRVEKVNMEKTIADQNKALEDHRIAQEKLNKEMEDARVEQKKIADAKAEQEWANLKKTYIPPGMVKDPKDEDVLRELAVNSPMEFHNKVAAVRIGQKKETGGREFSNKADEAAAEQAEMNRILANSPRVPGTLH